MLNPAGVFGGNMPYTLSSLNSIIHALVTFPVEAPPFHTFGCHVTSPLGYDSRLLKRVAKPLNAPGVVIREPYSKVDSINWKSPSMWFMSWSARQVFGSFWISHRSLSTSE